MKKLRDLNQTTYNKVLEIMEMLNEMYILKDHSESESVQDRINEIIDFIVLNREAANKLVDYANDFKGNFGEFQKIPNLFISSTDTRIHLQEYLDTND